MELKNVISQFEKIDQLGNVSYRIIAIFELILPTHFLNLWRDIV
jgi:hypothetical protein